MAVSSPARQARCMTEHITHTNAVRRLERSSSDKMLTGVCGGLGRYFDLNPTVFRVGFVVLTLLGGAGADCEMELNRLDEAERYIRQATLLALELGARTDIATSLDIRARIAAARDDPRSAGLFFGAVLGESERSRLGQWEASERDATVEQLSAVAGPEFDRALEEGKVLTLEAAAELAMRET